MRSKRHLEDAENLRIRIRIGMRNRPLIEKIEKALAESARLRNEWEKVINERRKLHGKIEQTMENVRHAQTVTQQLCSVSVERRVGENLKQEERDRL
jgi:hypothetical protein